MYTAQQSNTSERGHKDRPILIPTWLKLLPLISVAVLSVPAFGMYLLVTVL